MTPVARSYDTVAGSSQSPSQQGVVAVVLDREEGNVL